MATGRVVHVVGPVVDVEFYGGDMPALHNALHIRDADRDLDIVLEVEEHRHGGVWFGHGGRVAGSGWQVARAESAKY